MKWVNWNYIRMGLVALIHGALAAILIRPWLQLAALRWQFRLSFGVVWSFIAVLVCIVAVKKALSRGKAGWRFVITGLTLPMVLAALLRLPILLFIPLTVLLFFVGIRFNNYPRRARFAIDWAVGSMLLILTSSLEGVLGIQVNAASVLLFFALGITAMIMWNATALEESGLEPDYRGLGRSISIFIFVVGGLSLVLGVLLSPSFLQSFIGVIQRIYLFIADAVLLLIIRPFAWLLTPLFRWVENLELEEVPLELPGGELAERELLPSVDSSLSPEAMEVVTWLGWAVFVVFLLVVLGIVIRRLMRRSAQKKEDLVKEERESVFSRQEVLSDIKSALRGLLKPFTRLGQSKWYKGDNPLLIIRTTYARFAMKARRKLPMPKASTPREYSESLVRAEVDLDHEELDVLTKLYNDARYGGTGDQDAVSRIGRAFREVW